MSETQQDYIAEDWPVLRHSELRCLRLRPHKSCTELAVLLIATARPNGQCRDTGLTSAISWPAACPQHISRQAQCLYRRVDLILGLAWLSMPLVAQLQALAQPRAVPRRCTSWTCTSLQMTRREQSIRHPEGALKFETSPRAATAVAGSSCSGGKEGGRRRSAKIVFCRDLQCWSTSVQ